MKKIFAVGGVLLVILGGFYLWQNRPRPPLETKFVQNIKEQSAENIAHREEGKTQIKEPGDYALLDNLKHTYQIFNNCGPATLSMILSWHGKSVSQKELGDAMRPFQNQ